MRTLPTDGDSRASFARNSNAAAALASLLAYCNVSGIPQEQIVEFIVVKLKGKLTKHFRKLFYKILDALVTREEVAQFEFAPILAEYAPPDANEPLAVENAVEDAVDLCDGLYTKEDDPSHKREKFVRLYRLFNDGQQPIMKEIAKAVRDRDFKRPYYLVTGSAGVGKSFLYAAIDLYTRSLNYKPLCKFAKSVYSHQDAPNRCVRVELIGRFAGVAHTGIAACILPQGQTSHRAFRLPVVNDSAPQEDFDERMQRIISPTYKDELRTYDLVIWDEISSSSKWNIDAADQRLRRLHRSEEPFGGKVRNWRI